MHDSLEQGQLTDQRGVAKWQTKRTNKKNAEKFRYLTFISTPCQTLKEDVFISWIYWCIRHQRLIYKPFTQFAKLYQN
jgi:hypothetical protein